MDCDGCENRTFDPLDACRMHREAVQLRCPRDDDCAICLTSMRDRKVKYLRCTHVFHHRCVTRWLQSHASSCPTCRRAIPSSIELPSWDDAMREIQALLDAIER